MLPEGWSRRPLHEVADVRTGVAKGKTGLIDPVELPYLRVANVQDGFIDLSEVKTIAVERHQIDRYSLQAGDILMTEGGDFDKLGRGAVWGGTLDPCLHQNHVFAVRAKRELVNPLFLSALSGSEYGRTYFLGCAKRSTNLASINSSQLKAFPVLLPPVPEQDRIAHILSTWDQAIVTAEKLLENSQHQKSALMYELFSRRKEAGDWKAYQLGELFTERAEGKQDSLPLLSITRDDGIVLRDSVGRKDTSNEDKSKYLRICPGDIGYNTMRMWQGVSALSQIEGIVSPAYTIVVPNEKIDARFASYLFKLEEMIFTFYRHSQGLVSDTWNLKFEHFKKIRVHIPMRAEQERAVRVLTAADDLINAQKAQIKKLRKEKSALMAQLLTGKRRVRLPTGEASAA
ncbi:restriction endonuclease subunit S [Xanthomonas campestris]|uniref:restriction endonuclease subunit S n=1 Tax=Xanthomonas campestris TaxID=339 RepID=UPI001E5A74F4|nr:restriction endonuclease subunit S [Xanthomonas campestris]MCC4602568.1 restriction endonuclease subunit S [Xanthomonas campestris pv. parthenii]